MPKKVLLVEDDNNLKEIFQMRLQAEGYNIVTAADGEEGLVISLKEKPDLIIADIMMPKLSGFEMVENMRASPEMKDVKVIMMTALGQAEDQARGEKLGVVKYLVKSQVTLEDLARVVKEVLGPGDPQGVAAAQPAAQATTKSKESEGSMQPDSSNPTPNPSDTPSGDQSSGAAPSGDTAMPAGTDQQTTSQEQSTVNQQVDSAMGGSDSAPAPAGDSSTGMPSADTGSGPAVPPASEPPAAPATINPVVQLRTPLATRSNSGTKLNHLC
jgi:CheY-like chemotaxis protein